MAEQLLQCSGSQQEFAEQEPLFEEQWDFLEECLLSRWSCLSCLNTNERFEKAEAVMNSLFVGLNEQKKHDDVSGDHLDVERVVLTFVIDPQPKRPNGFLFEEDDCFHIPRTTRNIEEDFCESHILSTPVSQRPREKIHFVQTIHGGMSLLLDCCRFRAFWKPTLHFLHYEVFIRQPGIGDSAFHQLLRCFFWERDGSFDFPKARRKKCPF